MGNQERPIELTPAEQGALLQWARRAKSGDERILLRRCPESGDLIADPMSDTERPKHTEDLTS